MASLHRQRLRVWFKPELALFVTAQDNRIGGDARDIANDVADPWPLTPDP
jgi:hypothetical protein